MFSSVAPINWWFGFRNHSMSRWRFQITKALDLDGKQFFLTAPVSWHCGHSTENPRRSEIRVGRNLGKLWSVEVQMLKNNLQHLDFVLCVTQHRLHCRLKRRFYSSIWFGESQRHETSKVCKFPKISCFESWKAKMYDACEGILFGSV